MSETGKINSFEKNKKNNINKEKIKEKILANTNKLNESINFFGFNIAISYCPDEIIANNEERDTKNVSIPNSSGI